MSSTYTSWGMTPQSYRSYNRWHFIIALLLLLALVLLPWMTGGRIGPHGWLACGTNSAPAAVAPAAPAVAAERAPLPPPPTATSAALPSVAALVPVPTAPPAAPMAPPPAARVYFELNKARLPDDAEATLNDVVAYMLANPGAKAVVSGFHDERGGADSQYNQILAKRRANAVADAMKGAGVGLERLVLSKPSVTTGSGKPEEARRVEVSVTP